MDQSLAQRGRPLPQATDEVAADAQALGEALDTYPEGTRRSHPAKLRQKPPVLHRLAAARQQGGTAADALRPGGRPPPG